jgi:hypothetical protein
LSGLGGTSGTHAPFSRFVTRKELRSTEIPPQPGTHDRKPRDTNAAARLEPTPTDTNRSTSMTPLQNGPQQHQREATTSKNSHPARRETEPGFGICAPRALEIWSRFSFCSAKVRFHEQLRWVHHDGGTKAHTGPAKPEPVYYRSIVENPHRYRWGWERTKTLGDQCAYVSFRNVRPVTFPAPPCPKRKVGAIVVAGRSESLRTSSTRAVDVRGWLVPAPPCAALAELAPWRQTFGRYHPPLLTGYASIHKIGYSLKRSQL